MKRRHAVPKVHETQRIQDAERAVWLEQQVWGVQRVENGGVEISQIIQGLLV